MIWLLWTDIETTGLDEKKDEILQIACVLTDMSLSIEHVFPETNLSCSKKVLDNMDTWCKEHHGKSGLTQKVENSQISLGDAENSIVGFVNHHASVNDVIYIAGNSVHFDKRFIDKYMPKLSKRLSYKILDVSSIALMFDNLVSGLKSRKPTKLYLHTAQADILESIEEYKFYVNLAKRLGNMD